MFQHSTAPAINLSPLPKAFSAASAPEQARDPSLEYSPAQRCAKDQPAAAENLGCGARCTTAFACDCKLTISFSTPLTPAAESCTSMFQVVSHDPPGGSTCTRPLVRSNDFKFGKFVAGSRPV